MTQQQRVGPLAEWALMALITAALGALAIINLPVKFLFDFAWGIPIIMVIKRHDMRVGVLTLFTAFFLTWLFTEPLLTGLLFLELAPLALVFGLLFKKEAPAGRTLLTGAAVSALSATALILVLFSISPAQIMPDEGILRRQAELVTALYMKMGLMNAGDARHFAEIGISMAPIFIPGSFIISAILRALITYLLTTRVMRRLTYRVDPLPPFSQWRLPWYSVWLFIGGLGLTLIGDHYRVYNLGLIGKITLFSVLPLFFTIGLAIFTYFFKSWKIPGWAKAVLALIAVYNWSGSILLFTMAGLFDPLYSLRFRKKTGE